MKIKVKHWTGVAYWVWDLKDPDDICGICQSGFDGCCANCREGGDQCPLLFGKCSHIFHMHCIIRWVDSQNQQNEPKCPMCKRDWRECASRQNGSTGTRMEADSCAVCPQRSCLQARMARKSQRQRQRQRARQIPAARTASWQTAASAARASPLEPLCYTGVEEMGASVSIVSCNCNTCLLQ
ncbi:RING/U-box [Acaromyces ingoldii]|uniref:Anaphase-promoting complex subunit 11 n=1 Tax=Acaromyces ingoldii TaxID=215250 RepID=A0A316YY34_9BASI|nr:RING/U-box [Acaromyces ingoldii]PWN94032.1 RING/U-box [Acaromyces ingoldii]